MDETKQISLVHRLVDHALTQRQVPEKDRQAHASQLFRCTHTLVHACTHTRARARARASIHTHTHKHTHTHTHTHCSYAVRILGSKLSSKALNDEQAVLQALRQELDQQGKTAEAAR